MSNDPFWQRMEDIWRGQIERGYIPRTTEEVESERRAIRAESESEMETNEQIRNSRKADANEEPAG